MSMLECNTYRHQTAVDIRRMPTVSHAEAEEDQSIPAALQAATALVKAFKTHLDPLLVCERGPDVVGLCDDGLVRPEQHAGLVHVHMQSAQDEDEPREGGVRGDGLQPVVVDVEQHHLRLAGLQDQIPELLDLYKALPSVMRCYPGPDQVWSYLWAPTAD